MQPLSDLTLCEGEIAQMEVKFSQENVEGIWKKNGRPVEASNRVHIVIDKQIHKLLIEDTNKDDSGVYSFEVPAQEISTSAKLVIQSKNVALITIVFIFIKNVYICIYILLTFFFSCSHWSLNPAERPLQR